MLFLQQINVFRNENKISVDVLKKILNDYIISLPADMKAIVKQAVDDACHYHYGQKRADNQDYVVHVLRVAILFSSITEGKIDNREYCNGIIAALLHDTLEDTNINRQYIINKYGNKVISIIDSLTSKKINENETVEERKKRKIEKWQKLYFADDIMLWIHACDTCDNAISWRNMPFNGEETKISRWLFQTKEYSIPLFEKRFPEAVTVLKEEIFYQRSRGVIDGDWNSL